VKAWPEPILHVPPAASEVRAAVHCRSAANLSSEFELPELENQKKPKRTNTPNTHELANIRA
jgi:hypothetical protein